jgi:hypothetical protein
VDRVADTTIASTGQETPMGIEDPDADRFEQLTPVSYDEEDEADDAEQEELPLDANPLDVADQHRSVPVDDDALER